ncbi:hypothetical protein BASA81_008006 [Batrachochytrium salamandrivorans]|nr:hypothetical protein BASA81_008006 [Batrachochytrium salamandrivorans]
MSSRHTRRLQAEAKPKGGEDSDGEEEEVAQPKSSFAFSKLCSSSGEDDDDDKEEVPKPTPRLPPPSSSSSKKKKSKPKQQQHKANEDDEDAFLNQIVAATSATTTTPTSESTADTSSRFKFALDHLNPDEEVKRKLGKALFRKTDNRNKSGDRNKLTRKFSLVTPQPEWPMPPTFHSGEAACRMVKNETTGRYFLQANDKYLQSQMLYQQCVASFDPQQLVELVSPQHHPFQIDALLQLFDFFQSRQQNEYALQMLHRALFALEAWCGAKFFQQLDKAQLEPNSPLNPMLLRALDLAMRLACRRDCFETAFALSMLIQSLSVEEPTYAVLHCDYFALRSGNAKWSADSHLEGEIANVPAVAFGRALALFSLRRTAEANSALVLAMHQFPKFAQCVLDNRVDDEDDGSAAAYEPRLSLQAFLRQEFLWTPEVASWMRSLRPVQSNNNNLGIDLPLRQFLAQCSLAELTDKISLLPAEALAQEQDEDEFFHQVQQEFVQEQDQQRAPIANVDVHAGNNLLLFLQTMLPWARLPENQ